MKQMNTIVKEVDKMTEDTLYSVIEDTHVDFEKLTRKQKQSFLALNEIRKAIVNSKYDFFFDCDFENSDFHNAKKIANGEDKYLVDYACIVSRQNTGKRLLQIYATSFDNYTHFKVCTTCEEAFRLSNVFETIGYKTLTNTKTGRAKTTQRTAIPYTDIVESIKSVLTILENGGKNA